LKENDIVKIPPDIATKANAPYTGRGFTGSKNIVLPELVQEQRNFVKGDILSIYDSKSGNVKQQFVFDKKLGWLEK